MKLVIQKYGSCPGVIRQKMMSHLIKHIILDWNALSFWLRYILKPEDRLTFGLHREDYGEDEVDWWRDAQVISPSKALFRIFNGKTNAKHSPFNLYGQTPEVIDLPLHLENNQNVQFQENASNKTRIGFTFIYFLFIQCLHSWQFNLNCFNNLLCVSNKCMSIDA